MRHGRITARWWPLLLVLALITGACSAPAPTEDRVAPAPTIEVVPVVASPLESELGFASEPARRQQQLLELQRKADDELVRCMRAQGFFYVVPPVDEALRAGAFVGDGTREWVAEYGLGITSSFQEALAPRQGVVVDAEETNLAYVDSLTTAQATDYDRALIGDVTTDATGAEYRPQGCWGGAFGEIVTQLGFIDEFRPELASLNSRLASDPRVQGFARTWSACMEVAGFRFSSEAELVDDVYARLLAIELREANGVTTIVTPDAIDDLLAYERQVGLASHDCRAGFVDELVQLRFDYEREFLDDNRFRIADLRGS